MKTMIFNRFVRPRQKYAGLQKLVFKNIYECNCLYFSYCDFIAHNGGEDDEQPGVLRHLHLHGGAVPDGGAPRAAGRLLHDRPLRLHGRAADASVGWSVYHSCIIHQAACPLLRIKEEPVIIPLLGKRQKNKRRGLTSADLCYLFVSCSSSTKKYRNAFESTAV